MKPIERKEYLDKLCSFRDKQIIKVVTGVRRCGKSTLLAMYQDLLHRDGVFDERIVSINLEDYDFIELCDPKNLHTYVKERLKDGEMTYVFIDEVQNCRDFPAVVDSLYLRENIDIYITGSNANMLSSELATVLSGRYVEISMLPLSFSEYVEGTGGAHELERKFAAYISESSFPYTLKLSGRQSDINDYLSGIFSTIVVKDIAQRNRISDTLMLESVTRFVFDNIGSPVSTKKIADTMTSSGRKIDVKTVERYLYALMESYVVYRAGRYDIKGKQYLKTLEKYYVVDVGMRRMLLGSRAADLGHVLENVVYLELLRRGFEVYVGKLGEQEIDFVAVDSDGLTYYQVSQTVRDEQTLDRELAPLKKIADHYPKYILTLDVDPDADYDGIRRINALDWLLGKAKS